ncbi:MAG: hypothetical protein GF417_12920 [Candidatus Latescibacteria bacterium]|nr:hypothetical protein [bacterium]MBD3425331.1 hypothetical protein [Candidatus Latescibacterota bacterium]
MMKRILITLFLVTLLASSLQAVVIRGTRGRRLLRYQYLKNRWQNDKLRIYNEYGFPIHRYRVRGYGRVREHWKYYEEGLEFVFDEESNLVKTNRFWPEDRRERFRRY